jgi:organic radical activating enzyme
MAELERIIHFFKQSDIKGFSLLGGEPTLHPEFNQLAQKIVDEGFLLSLFSNGLIPPDVLNFLTGKVKERLSMVVNINHPDDNSTSQWEQVGDTLKVLGNKAGLGYNIYKPSPSLEFLPEIIEKYALRKYIRLSIAQPISKANNTCLALEDYPALAPRLVDFAQACDRFDIKLAFDCGFILCMFDEKQLGRLYTYNVNLGFYCNAAVDVGPGLEIWHCFPLSYTYNRNLAEFEHYQQIIDFYRKKFQPFRLFGSLPKCSHCKYLRRGQCSGGCLSHKMKTFHM